MANKSKKLNKVTVLNTLHVEDRVTHVAGAPVTECVDDTLDTYVFILKGYPRELFEEFDIVEWNKFF